MKSLHSYKPVFCPRPSGVVLPAAIDHPVIEEDLLSIPINPNNFPAKLWRLVNNPEIQSINWNPSAEGVIIIHQKLFESELLSPVKLSVESSDVFKTTNFTSFIRQMNLYGFRKLPMSSGSFSQSGKFGGDIKAVNGSVCKDLLSNIDTDRYLNTVGDQRITDGTLHHFLHPNFKKGHPELLVNVKRLTGVNKAKLEAGIEVTCRKPSQKRKFLSYSTGSSEQGRLEDQDSTNHDQTHHAFYMENLHFMKGPDPSPISQHMWPNHSRMYMRKIDGYSQHPDWGMPVSVYQGLPLQASCAVQTNSSQLHDQQSPQRIGDLEHNFNWHLTHVKQYPSLQGTCHCCSSSSVGSIPGCADQHSSIFPHYNYYQLPCPVGGRNSFSPNWQHTSSCSSEESRKMDVSLETVFQIADELQVSPKASMVKVEMDPLQTPTQEGTAAKEHLVSDVSSHVAESSLSQLAPIELHNFTPLSLETVPISATPDFQTEGIITPVSTVGAPEASVQQLKTEPSTIHLESWGSLKPSQSNEISKHILHSLPEERSLTAMENKTSIYGTNTQHKQHILQSQSLNLVLLVDVACKQEPSGNKDCQVPVIQSPAMNKK
ncbi:heat shock factor protein 5 [Erpetoichthys calabaricus]|uniref:heat shock factor protein 5 n=1 Tax=Erpetoichthys calabaricus TaxID=27687 RepID=UPI002234A502|nr:heat shock factor protein 5 [Erpetoichthys calabaricus]